MADYDNTGVKFASVSESTSGDQEIVPAVSGKKIRVLSVSLVCASAVALTWKSGSTAISGAMSFGANGGYSTESDFGVFETAAGEALNLNLGGNVQVSGHLVYVEV